MVMEGPLVAIVDDQRDVRTTLSRGLAAFDFRCHPFSNGQDLIDALIYLEPDCILLDLRMPMMDGIETLKAIPAGRRHIPVIFFTSHGEISVAVEAMKLGASDFIEKPASFSEIADKIRKALINRSRSPSKALAVGDARRIVASLTTREQEILRLACDGLSNKQCANLLGLSVRTVEAYRLRATTKIGHSNLVKIAQIFQTADG